MIENTISINSTDEFSKGAEAAGEETKVQNSNCSAQDERTVCEANETEETEIMSDAEPAEPRKADQPEKNVELTVYGEKIQVPFSQVVAAAQKGMAFEHLKAELADIKNDYRIKVLDEVAKQSGTDTYQLAAQMQHRAVAENLINRYGSLDAVPLDELGQAVNTLMAGRKQLEDGKTAMEYSHWKNQLREFADANRGCTEIPPEVIQAAKNGENLSLAYNRIYGNRLTKEIEEAKRELDILKSESKAVKNSTPSAKSVGGNSKPKENEFLKLMKSTW